MKLRLFLLIGGFLCMLVPTATTVATGWVLTLIGWSLIVKENQ